MCFGVKLRRKMTRKRQDEGGESGSERGIEFYRRIGRKAAKVQSEFFRNGRKAGKVGRYGTDLFGSFVFKQNIEIVSSGILFYEANSRFVL